MIRTYSELCTLSSFEDRFHYLQLHGSVGLDTFGFDRYLNQKFYKSSEWKHVRDQVIFRDNGCDLAYEGHEIFGKIIIHHMNPVTIEDLENNPGILLNPEFLVCVSMDTHNAIHYGDDSILKKNSFIDRTPNDTTLWKK